MTTRAPGEAEDRRAVRLGLQLSPRVVLGQLEGYCAAQRVNDNPRDLGRGVEGPVRILVPVAPTCQVEGDLQVVPDVARRLRPRDVQSVAGGDVTPLSQSIGEVEALAVLWSSPIRRSM